MARIESIFQPFGTPPVRHGDFVRRTLSNPDFSEFKISPAFVTSSGVFELAEELTSCGASLQCVAGINNGVTTAQGLLSLFAKGIELFVADTRSSQSIFHQKVYCGYGDTNGEVIIGSTNLTFRALNNNIEASVLVRLDRSEPEDQILLNEVTHFFDDITNNFSGFVDRIVRPRQIVELLIDRRVEDERVARFSPGSTSSSSATAQTSGIGLPFSTPPRPTTRRRPRTAVGSGPSSTTPATTPTALPPIAAAHTASTPSPVAAAAQRRTTLVMQIKPHHNGEIFLSKKAVNQNPGFFGFPFSGRTTPKRASNPSYPQRDPDPVVDIEVFGAGGAVLLTLTSYDLNTVYYETKKEIRVTASPLVPVVPEYSIMIMRPGATGSGLDYSLEIHTPQSPAFGSWLGRCNQTMPGGGKAPRKFGWI